MVLPTRFGAPLVVGLLACVPGVLAAQQADTVHRDTVTLTGSMTFGARNITGDFASSKFLEYRDMPRGMYLDAFRLAWLEPTQPYYLTGSAQHALQQDGAYRLEAGRTGSARFDLSWNQTPHVMSNSGRSLYTGVGGATLRLADVLQQREQNSTTRAADLQSFLSGGTTAALRLRRDRGASSFRYTWAPAWALRVGYSIEQNDGTRPLGTVTGPSPGATGTIAELPQPLSYRTQQVEASLARTAPRWSLELGYLGSLFHNPEPALVWDNPLRITDSIGGQPSGPSQSRMALAPDNTAHALHATGAVNTPLLDSRFVATAAYTMMRQNDAFLPHTINSAISDPRLALPASSLDGKVNTLLLSTLWTARLVRGVNLAARYRLYDVDNRTQQLLFPAHVVNDATLNTEARLNLPYGYRRQTGGADLSWRPTTMVSVRGGLGFEQWRRDFREVSRSNEGTQRLSVDFTPSSWITLRAGYIHGHRTPKGYDPAAPLAGLPGDTTIAQLALLRKFDEADRRRNRYTASADVTPVENLVLTGSFGRTNDDYDGTVYGLQLWHDWDASFSGTYTLTQRISLFADYDRELGDSRMRGRQRSGAQPDSSRNDWISTSGNTSDTYGIGLEWVADAHRDFGFSVSYNAALASEEIHTAKADATSTLVTTAVNYPTVRTRLHWFETSVHYGLAANLLATAQYRYERYTENDFANDIMDPYMGTITGSGAALDMYLGARYGNYNANILAVFLTWSPVGPGK